MNEGGRGMTSADERLRVFAPACPRPKFPHEFESFNRFSGFLHPLVRTLRSSAATLSFSSQQNPADNNNNREGFGQTVNCSFCHVECGGVVLFVSLPASIRLRRSERSRSRGQPPSPAAAAQCSRVEQQRIPSETVLSPSSSLFGPTFIFSSFFLLKSFLRAIRGVRRITPEDGMSPFPVL
ncbi:hypothetical protein L596_001878 [Steinernema carpocapsae]|uniref:Uncharacterized protein n=1 Tax=Steinernema carpocapsae TaxID=34508 RepID=A0A4U8UME5_STECR|nr:hypothetical protein L596_001878 [Steinernema carpocapsae]